MTDNKNWFRLAKLTIIFTFLSITVLGIVWMVLQNNPTSLHAITNFKEGLVEVNCEFASENSTK